MWEQIRSNQIRSVALTVFMLAILALVGWFLGVAFGPEDDGGLVGLVIALVIWLVMALVSFFQGDQIQLSISKAKKISKKDNLRLWNVVEEMTLACGLSQMPNVYVVNDPAPNAFATGRNEKTASVAVTTGLLSALNRDELQGVIAHEMAHIKNRDVLLMSMVSIMLGAIVLIAWYGSRVLVFGGGGRSNNNSGNIVLLIIGLVFIILAPLFAHLVFFAVSRKREYLADASSALYTRYPEGLASALEKIGSSTAQVKAANDATAAMYVANPFRKKDHKINLSALTSTHPPIAQRVRILREMNGSGTVSYDKYEKLFEASSSKTNRRAIPAGAMGVSAEGVRTASADEEPIGLGSLGQQRNYW